MAALSLPIPPSGPAAAAAWVTDHLRHVCGDEPVPSSIRGGQAAADAALAAWDVRGYASRRNEVWPPGRRGASKLSPYIRHGLLSLPTVWDHVAGGPSKDVTKFRDELLWQEYARHWYARLGLETSVDLRHTHGGHPVETGQAGPFDPTTDEGDMACVAAVVGELHDDGWLVNQTRMWLASHWSVRHGAAWQDGEDHFFRHLLDGSRAANRLGWQWTTGTGSSKPYGFSRWQVNKRAPGLCASCDLRDRCPIEAWPDDRVMQRAEPPTALRVDADPTATAGPARVLSSEEPEAVWLTAESLGADDPAALANPELPLVFVFDEPLLAHLGLSGKRLVFLAETLAELAAARELEVLLGDPVDALSDRQVATTFAPVPGFARRADRIGPVEIHPWRWLRRPNGGSIASFSAWRKHTT